MDISYLNSIVGLYLKNETNDKKTNLNIVKTTDDKIQFNFNMNENEVEVTTFILPFEVVFENENINDLIKKYKQNLIIIDEKYHSDNENQCEYHVLFNNGRSITFKNFNIVDINNIRNIIYDIKFHKEEIRVNIQDEEDNNYYFNLLPTGFVKFKAIFIIGSCFLVIFIISLLLFKVFLG